MNALRLQRPRRPSRRPSRRIGRSRFASDRGAAAVEFALVAALLIPFVYGVIDYGLLWQKRQTVQGATRQGAREAATTCLVSNDPANTCDAGNRANDDYRVLVAARSVLGGALDQVQTMVVYRIQANGYVDSLPDGTHPPITNGMPVALCREAAATGGVDGYCNVYGPEVLAALDAMTPADRDLVFSCDPFAPAGQGLSKYFCPTGGLRGRSVGANASIGVFIRLRHSHLTGLFGASSEVTDYTVFRLEPNGSAPTAPDVLTPPDRKSVV